ncbi:DNA recombination protein RmuC [Streptodolium elevatio]|uniref:DNA recombination protein RmuC n=1 Tax=Streptodolium elevatio TaxID=3157996 RepID=A0ABV3DTP8_9ACTN
MTATAAITALVTALVGFAVGLAIARARSTAAHADTETARKSAEDACARADAQVQEWRTRCEQAEGQTGALTPQLVELRTRLADRESRLARTDAELKAARDAESATENARVDLAHDLTALRTDYASQGRELASTQQALAAITAERDAARITTQEREADLARQRTEYDALRTQFADRARELAATREEGAKLVGAMAALREELDALKTANADLEGRQKTLEQQAAALDAARGEVERLRTESAKLMEDRFAALTSKALESNRTALLATAEDKLGAVGAPVREQLDKLNQEIRKLGESRAAAEASLAQQLIGMHQETGRLRDQAQALVDALKKPQVRGSWGEMTLRRTAELAGMVERCDFKEQVTMQGDEGVLRPDMVVHLADGKATVVDAKVSLKAFMEASEATDDATRSARLKEHAQQVRRHIDNLASKDYHKLLDVSPEFVVMFIPGEAFLGPALDADNGLLEYALDKGVVITTPTTFIALLRTVALAWTQASLAENLREVHDLGRDLYDRIVTFSSHLGKVGTELGSAVLAYNKAVGSMEARLLVSARRFQHLKVAAKPLSTPTAIEAAPRPLTAAELVDTTTAGRVVEIPPARAPEITDGSA